MWPTKHNGIIKDMKNGPNSLWKIISNELRIFNNITRKQVIKYINKVIFEDCLMFFDFLICLPRYRRTIKKFKLTMALDKAQTLESVRPNEDKAKGSSDKKMPIKPVWIICSNPMASPFFMLYPSLD
jgi:hypothetical protein